ncbi:hypothetical protein TanjilG_27924 [Lupinus angustifolius]|uniref:Calmodulin-binding protein n=1 Tax=Lupinus angustifolius TaxID=3871 RepID=A0A4P1RG98_LUPAN|nr:PREDICTED: uncharacterized protein LOC109349428 [Lupinus angustifolius]OIW10173.1 hypothetical protein TanjilG_27924 [Lupinus angustifolius]
MEVVVAVAPPPPTVDFNFDSNCSSPYITAPSSPQRFGNLFFSAPTSPTRVSTFLDQLNNFTTTHSSSSSSSIPFQWEQQPGVPKPQQNNNKEEYHDDFEFNFTGHLEPPPLSAADELFDGGKIKPLKPPPRLQLSEGITSPRSPRKGKKIFSPRHNQKRDIDSDPFAMALEETRRREEQPLEQRGRERVPSSSSSSRKGTRSLSPLRVSDVMFETEDKVVSSTTSNTKSSSSYVSFLSSIPFTKGYRKWRLKDFLLFRSASEGRATDKDPLRNFDVLSKKSATEEDVRNSSFRSTESSGSVSSRRRGPVSAHELHYTMNRAASEEMKKKTLLPYKQGLLGCLGFNPGMNQISKGIGSFASRS